MGRFLRFVVFFVLLIGAFVLVVLPLLVGPILAGAVRGAGLDAATLNVSVALFDPTLLLGKSRKVTLTASGVDVSPAHVGNLSLSLGNTSFFDRTFQTVSGDLSDVIVSVNSTDDVHVDDISVEGPANAASATAHLSAADTDRLIRLAGQRAGINIDEVTVGDSGVTVKIKGIESNVQLTVSGGALVLDPGVGGAIVLLQPAPSDPWSLQEAWVSADGLNVRALVDVARITSNLGS